MRRLEFVATTVGLEAALRRQPDPGKPLLDAIRAAWGCLDTDPTDERVWKVTAAVDWPQDSFELSVRPSGKIVRLTPLPLVPVERGGSV